MSKLFLYILIILLFIFSCNEQKNNKWKELECGLFINPKGAIGFPSAPEIANIPNSKLKPEQCPNVFITKIGWNDTTKLNQVIDINTFEDLGACFYKDKNRIYSYYPMCDGGYFNIFKKDTTDFRIVSDWYAKDNKDVFYMSKKTPIGVDYSSFESKEGWGQLAKDKYHFYAFGDTISKAEFYNNLPR